MPQITLYEYAPSRGARVLDQVLGNQGYPAVNQFTITDIVASFAVKWLRVRV